MVIRLSPASMLTALAILAAPVVSTCAQTPDPVPSAKARYPKAGTSASAKSGSKQADVTKSVVDRKRKEQKRKVESRRRREENNARMRMQAMWMQMQAMMRQADRELEFAKVQAARMEGIERQEAQERMMQLEMALSEARATESLRQRESMLAYDDPEQYRRYQQAQSDALTAQRQAFQSLAQALQVRQAQQSRSAGPSGGTSGSVNSSPGPGIQPLMPSNSGATVTPIPTPDAPVRSLADKDKSDMAEMRKRYP